MLAGALMDGKKCARFAWTVALALSAVHHIIPHMHSTPVNELSSKLLRLRYCCILCVGNRTYSFDSEEMAVRGRIPLLAPLWGAPLLIKRKAFGAHR